MDSSQGVRGRTRRGQASRGLRPIRPANSRLADELFRSFKGSPDRRTCGPQLPTCPRSLLPPRQEWSVGFECQTAPFGCGYETGVLMSSLIRDAQQSVQAVAAFHTHHSGKTYYAGQPGIEPWLRDTLVSLQDTLNTIAATQLKIAEQLDRTSNVVDNVVTHLNRQ